MQLIADASGIESLRERIAMAREALPTLLQRAALQAGTSMKDGLSNAAPKGKGTGVPPAGDASGPLSESFFVQFESESSISVRTTQSTKLEYVTKGTGVYGPRGARIVPVTKKALYWDGANQPYRSVAGQKPNDFVAPVLATAPAADAFLQVVVDELTTTLEGA